MKAYLTSLMLIGFFLSALYSCKKDDSSNGAWKSGPLEEYHVTAINGGAIVTYTIPRDSNILYIMAEYKRNGEDFTEKSSVYKNLLRIEGFDTKEEVHVKLYKVNKQGQKSEAVELKFTPLKSLVDIAHDTLKLGPAFGGIVASWSNPLKTPLGVHLMFKNDQGELETKEVYFSTLEKDEYVFRGFESKEYTFAVCFTDKWGNTSDTTFYTTKPFYETMIAKPYGDMRAVIPYDNATDLNTTTYVFPNIWDNIVNTSHHGWLTKPGNSGVSITLDLGQVVKLSRVVIHGYHVNSPYTQVNFTKFEMWGTKKIDEDKLKDDDYWLDEYSVRTGSIFENGVTTAYELPAVTFEDVWQYFGFFSIVRYDLMNPPDPQAILNLAANGSEYLMPVDAEPVRYVRIFVREVSNSMPPPANNYFSMGEITFYGDNTVPQD